MGATRLAIPRRLRGRLGWGRPGGEEGAIDAGPAPLDDLLYLPPIFPDRAEERDRLARERLAAGTPALLQLRPGETAQAPGAVLLYDLLTGRRPFSGDSSQEDHGASPTVGAIAT